MRKLMLVLFVVSAGSIFAASTSGAGVVPPVTLDSDGFTLNASPPCDGGPTWPPGSGPHFLRATTLAETADSDDDVNVGEEITYTYFANSSAPFTGNYEITIGLSNGSTLLIEEDAVPLLADTDTAIGSAVYTVGAADAGTPLTATVTSVVVLNLAGMTTLVTCTPTTGNTIAVYVNAPPAPVDDTATTDAGMPVTKNVLANDGMTIDSTTSTGNAQNGSGQDDMAAAGPATIVTQATNGTCAPSGSDSITYTPAAGFSGTDSCTYELTDNDGATGRADLDIVVAAVPGIPPANLKSRIYVANRIASGPADYSFLFGTPTGQIIAGDWDGNGTDGFGSREGNVYTLVDERGNAFKTVGYGKATDTTLVGDWNANGTDTLAARRGNIYYLKNSIAPGAADIVLGYGRAGDEVFVGDWNGNGQDTFAVRRGNTFFVRNSTTSGPADIVFGYGKAGDEVLVGDWNQDGIDTFAVRRGNLIFIRNDFQPGPAQTVIAYGKAADQLIVGDWNGNGVDTFAVRRVE